MNKVTRADLEQQGFNVFDVGEEEMEQPIRTAGSTGDAPPQFYTAESRDRQYEYRSRIGSTQPQSNMEEDAKLVLKVATLALRFLALRVLLYGAGTVSSVLFYQVVQSPNVLKIVSAVLFTVLVFIPTLYYSSKSK